MKRCISIIFTVLQAVSFAYAKPITPDQALTRLVDKFGLQRIVSNKAKPTLVHTVNTRIGTPAVYIMNQPEQNGFIILSADDTAIPLLGYSDSGSFSAEQMPMAMQWWLDEYASQIEYANHVNAPSYNIYNANTDREPIAPMVKTSWDQAYPYNNVCPLYGSEKTYTGCIATTMAQVMNYWKYPAQGQGSISYKAYSINKQLTMSFAKLTIDWDNMLDEYIEGSYNEAEADAVAKLMRACGYSVKMDYSIYSSSALALDIANAMVTYFKYDPNAHYAIRALYSTEQWEDMIYDNLKNVGPIPYGGISKLGEGHSFVCDGYDGNGYFHINWGWSGKSNGYFLLDALNPDSLGAGGGMEGGYNFSQDAVLGIQPPTGEPVENPLLEIIQYGSLTGTVDESKLVFGLADSDIAYWINYNPKTLNVTFGATFEPLDIKGEAITVPIDFDKVKLKAGYATSDIFTPSIDLDKLNLADGTYKVTFATHIDEETRAEWIPVHATYNNNNYIILAKHEGAYSTTGIEKTHADNINNRYNIYNMCGIKAGADLELLPAGVYIRNGRKILKKINK